MMIIECEVMPDSGRYRWLGCVLWLGIVEWELLWLAGHTIPLIIMHSSLFTDFGLTVTLSHFIGEMEVGEYFHFGQWCVHMRNLWMQGRKDREAREDLVLTGSGSFCETFQFYFIYFL